MTSAARVFGKRSRMPETAGPAVDWKLPDQLIGVEIEVEDLPDTVWPGEWEPYWEKKRDGSLRSGSEFVLSAPLKGNQLSKAIHFLYEHSVFHRSVTGSTHIHVDMLEEETGAEVIKTLMLMVYALESAVFQMIGTGREWSGYTNSLASAPESLLGMALNATADTGYSELRNAANDSTVGRYYGLNLAAMAKFGSLEFRYFPTATSVEELIDWIQLVTSFKKAALETGTPEELVRVFSDEDLYQRFINTYFSEWATFFLSSVPHFAAHAMVKKALTVAETHKMSRDTPYRFDGRAISGNKTLAARYLKKKPLAHSIGNHFIVSNVGIVPAAREHLPGTVMFYNGNVYVASNNDWVSDYYDMSRTAASTAQNTLGALGVGRTYNLTATNSVALTRRLMSEGGCTPTRVVTALERASSLMNRMCSELGEYVPLAPEEEEDTTAEAVPAPTTMNTIGRRDAELTRILNTYAADPLALYGGSTTTTATGTTPVQRRTTTRTIR